MRVGVLSAGKLRFLSLVAIAIVATGGFIEAFGLPGARAQTPSYTGCVNYYTGNFRVLLYGGSCGPSEMPVTFGETGPPGPPGPPGPAGMLDSLINVGYEGPDITVPTDVGQAVPFDTTYTTVGTNIVHSTASTFTLGETGVYRIEFVLYGLLHASGGARIRVNGTPVGPTFDLRPIIGGEEDQLEGTLVLELTAGDVVDIFMGGGFVTLIESGSTLIITQLSSAPAP